MEGFQNLNVNFFSKREGGGWTLKFTFLKSANPVKEDTKWILLTKECVLLGSEIILRSFIYIFFIGFVLQ